MIKGREMVPETFVIHLSENGRKDLALIAETLGISLGKALSRAVGMEAFLVEHEKSGTEIVLKDRTGHSRRLLVSHSENMSPTRF
jgi:hypothetical protein